MNTYILKKLMLCLVLVGMMSPLMNAQDTTVEPVEPVTPVEPVAPELPEMPEEPAEPEPKKKKISIDINFDDGEDDDSHDHDHDHDGHDHDHDHDGHDHNHDSHDIDDDSDGPKKIDAFTSSFDLGLNYFMQDGEFDLGTELNDLEIDNWKSKTFSWHVVQARINLIQNVLNLRTGITLEWNAYDFDSGKRLMTSREQGAQNMVAFVQDEAINELDKNRLRTSYIIAPLMIDIKSNPRNTDKSFHLAAGGYVGARMGDSFKQKLDGEFKDVLEGDFHTAKIKYGLRGEIGYGGLAVFANYGLSDIFEEDEAGIYKVQPFTIGLNFGID